MKRIEKSWGDFVVPTLPGLRVDLCPLGPLARNPLSSQPGPKEESWGWIAFPPDAKKLCKIIIANVMTEALKEMSKLTYHTSVFLPFCGFLLFTCAALISVP